MKVRPVLAFVAAMGVGVAAGSDLNADEAAASGDLRR